MPKHNVFIRSAAAEPEIRQAVEDIFTRCHSEQHISRETNVVVKLNLSSIQQETIPASNTDPRLIEALCRLLRDLGARIKLVEADGLRYSAEEAFALNGTREMAEKYGAEVINLSQDRMQPYNHPLLEGSKLPETVANAEYFITMPVLKTHALTQISGALKNQWGCVPRYDRILLHKHLDQLIADLNAYFQPNFCLMDGLIAMEGRGPTSGVPKTCNLILGSTNPGALDATAARIIGVEPAAVRHLALYCEKGLASTREEDICVDPGLPELDAPFELARLDWPVALMNYLSRYRFFVHRILLNQTLFVHSRRVVNAMRKIGAA